MFSTLELAQVAIAEFRRGLEGLTEVEGIVRPPKADGTRMNAISWTVQHIGAHWWNVGHAVSSQPLESKAPPRDGTPPAYDAALAVLHEATSDLTWLRDAGDEALMRRPDFLRGESVGMFLARAIFHTWFHTGEINAVRQLLGHAPMSFVGELHGRLDWIPVSGSPPA
jgi:hypothetical protein